MFDNEIGRAKAFTQLHLFYCVIIVSTFGLYVAINGLPKVGAGDEVLAYALMFLMNLIYVLFCFVWCINDSVALLAIDEKIHCLVLCCVIFGFTMNISAVLILIYPSLIIACGLVWDLMALFRNDMTPDFIGNSFFGYMTLFTVVMFLGTILSSFSLYYSYQSKKEFSTLDSSMPDV